MNITYTFCPHCGALTDDRCQAHPEYPVVTEAHHPDDYATAKQAHAYAEAGGHSIRSFQVILHALTISRTEHGAIFRAEPTGLRRVRRVR